MERGGVSRVLTFKKRCYNGCKITCISDGSYLTLFSADTAKKHDLTILKEKMEEFAEMVRGKTVIADKEYVGEKFAGEMEVRGVKFTAIKRKNMIKSEGEAKYYRGLSKLRRRIETFFQFWKTSD
ncbi:transposase [Methanothermococcus sp. SCGC AD-155-C09]|nr:transposase [Methanothermococcus sp. SCGC AD-155-C09]